MKKPISLIIGIALLLPFLAGKGAAIGYDSQKNYDPANPYFSIMSPWDSFRSFLPAGGDNSIPATFIDTFDEFRSWYSVLPNLSDNIAGYWDKLTGNICEKAKIDNIQSRRAEYMADRRNITVGWWGYWTVEGAQIRIGDDLYSADEAYRKGITDYLNDFIPKEFAKIFDDNGGYSLLGGNGQINCQGDGYPDNPSHSPCTSDDPNRNYGEYCVTDVACVNIEGSDEIRCQVDMELSRYSQKAVDDLALLYCGGPNSEFGGDGQGGLTINEDNLYSIKQVTQQYIDDVIGFYTRAGALIPDIESLDMMYQYNDTKKVYEWVYEEEEDQRTRPNSCLDPNYSKFINVNYPDVCRCPNFQVDWTDLKGLFQELLASMKRLGDLRTNIDEIVSMNREGLGEAWTGFNNESKEEAKKQFKQQFGYYPNEDDGSEATWKKFAGLFKRIWNPANFISATLSLDNQVIIPPRNLSQILRSVESAVSITWLQNTHNEEQRKAAAIQIRNDRAEYAVRMINKVNNILANNYALSQAAGTLGGPGVSCQEIKDKSYAAVSSALNSSNSENKEGWSDFFGGASQFDSALNTFFGSREKDSCELAEEIKEKMRIRDK